MANVNLLYNKDIYGGTIVAGTSPESLSLGAQNFTLVNTEIGSLDTMYIDPLIGMYKTNAAAPLARYLLVKKGGANTPYLLSSNAYPELGKKLITTFTELHLSFDDASPFKFSLDFFPASTRYDPTRLRRLVFEAKVIGEIDYWLEEYTNNSPDSVRYVSPKRRLDLSFLGAPYLFMIRAYQGHHGILLEVLNEYSYYTNNPTITEFFPFDDEPFSNNQAFIAVCWHYRTAGKYPAIRSIGWGCVDPLVTVLSYATVQAQFDGIDYYFNSAPTSVSQLGTCEFKEWILVHGQQFSANGVLIEPDYFIIKASRRASEIVIYKRDGYSEANVIRVGGDSSPSTAKVSFKSDMFICLVPGAAARMQTIFKPVNKVK